MDSVKNPLKLLGLALRGVKTEGAMAKDISLEHQRPADYVFSAHVEEKLADIREGRLTNIDIRKAKKRSQPVVAAE